MTINTFFYFQIILKIIERLKASLLNTNIYEFYNSIYEFNYNITDNNEEYIKIQVNRINTLFINIKIFNKYNKLNDDLFIFFFIERNK